MIDSEWALQTSPRRGKLFCCRGINEFNQSTNLNNQPIKMNPSVNQWTSQDINIPPNQTNKQTNVTLQSRVNKPISGSITKQTGKKQQQQNNIFQHTNIINVSRDRELTNQNQQTNQVKPIHRRTDQNRINDSPKSSNYTNQPNHEKINQTCK